MLAASPRLRRRTLLLGWGRRRWRRRWLGKPRRLRRFSSRKGVVLQFPCQRAIWRSIPALHEYGPQLLRGWRWWWGGGWWRPGSWRSWRVSFLKPVAVGPGRGGWCLFARHDLRRSRRLPVWRAAWRRWRTRRGWRWRWRWRPSPGRSFAEPILNSCGAVTRWQYWFSCHDLLPSLNP